MKLGRLRNTEAGAFFGRRQLALLKNTSDVGPQMDFLLLLAVDKAKNPDTDPVFCLELRGYLSGTAELVLGAHSWSGKILIYNIRKH
jgi:hypothetical protein